jgi:hypothetical protein
MQVHAGTTCVMLRHDQATADNNVTLDVSVDLACSGSRAVPASYVLLLCLFSLCTRARF